AVQHAHRLTRAVIDRHRGREMVRADLDDLYAEVLGERAPQPLPKALERHARAPQGPGGIIAFHIDLSRHSPPARETDQVRIEPEPGSPALRYSFSRLRGGMSSGRSVHSISGHTCTRDLNRHPAGVFSNVSS